MNGYDHFEGNPMLLFREISRLRFGVSIFVLLFTSAIVVFFILTWYFVLLARNDSWRHYVGGGIYQCNAGSMSPCGEYLVFGSPKSGRGDVWRLHPKDSILHQITDSDDFESHPLYSPDGESIFYLREHGGYQHVWMTDKDGKNHEQLTFGEMYDRLRDMSPCGDLLIIFRASYRGGLGMIVGPEMIYSVSGREIVEKNMRENIGMPMWFLDNNTLLFQSSDADTQFGKYDMRSREHTILGHGQIQAVSPNKKFICIARGGGFLNRELFLFDVENQIWKKLGTGSYPSFKGDSKIFFVQSSPRRASVYSLEDGTTNEIELPGAIVWSPVTTPDGSGILLRLIEANNGDRSGSIYIFRNNEFKKLYPFDP